MEMSKGKKALLLVTLFASNIIIMSESIITPTINLLYTMFPEGVNLVNFAITGCYIVSILLSFVVGKLCEKFPLKSILTVGAILGTIGALGMIFLIQPLYLAIMRTLLMASYALTMTSVLMYLSNLYPDEIQRAKILGINNAIMTAIGAIFSLASGFLATKSINTAYSLHILVPVYLIMLIFFVPNMKNEVPATNNDASEANTEQSATSTKGAKMGITYWLTCINYSVFTLAFCSILYFISVYVAENNLGNEAVAGVMSTIITAVGFFTSLLYAKVFKKTGKKLLVISYAASACACIIMWLFPNLYVAYFALGIMGGMTCFLRVYHYAVCPSLVPENRAASSIAFIEAFTMIAVCITTYFVTYGMTLLKMATFTQFMLVPSVLMAANTVLSLFTIKTK